MAIHNIKKPYLLLIGDMQNPNNAKTAFGLRDWARTGHVWLVEWPERGGTRLPPADLTLAFAAGAQGHTIEVDAHSRLGESWLARLSTQRRGGG